MKGRYEEKFCRNIGIFTQEEQNKLKKTTIGIAGMGGVGGMLAERLIRIGVGKLKITDTGAFELSNFNRQVGANEETMNLKKADVLYHELKKINTEAEIIFNNEGIRSAMDASDFVDGCDLVIDEMDYGAWKESIYLQRTARKNGIHYLFSGAIGFGALLTNFDPTGMTLEEYNGISPEEDLEKIETGSVSSDKVLPIVPSYASDAMSMEMMKEILSGERPVPTCSIGVGLASLLAGNEAVNTLLRRKEIITAPNYLYVDLMDRKFITGSMTNNK